MREAQEGIRSTDLWPNSAGCASNFAPRSCAGETITTAWDGLRSSIAAAQTRNIRCRAEVVVVVVDCRRADEVHWRSLAERGA